MRLNHAQKAFIVSGLARFGTPTEVSCLFEKEFGLPVQTRQVRRYDPYRSGGDLLSAELQTLFFRTRADALTDVLSDTTTFPVVRLKRVSLILEAAEYVNYSTTQLKALGVSRDISNRLARHLDINPL